MIKTAAELLPGDQILGSPIIDDGSDTPATIIAVFTGKNDYKTILVCEKFGFLQSAHCLSGMPPPIGNKKQISYHRPQPDGSMKQIYPEVE